MHGEFGKFSMRTHGFYAQDHLGNYQSTGISYGGLGVVATDELAVDVEGKTGEVGYLVSKVRITGKLPNQDYVLGGTAGYFGADLSVIYGPYLGGSAATISFSTIDGLTSSGINGSVPTIGGTTMDQVVSSVRTGIYFGLSNSMSMQAAIRASGVPQVPYSNASGTWNFGTPNAPVKVEWAGVEVYDSEGNRLTTYTVKSASGFDYSLGEAVPVTPPKVLLTKEGVNDYKLAFPTKSYLHYQLRGSTDLQEWFDIGSEFAGDGLEREILETRTAPKFFWKLELR